MRQNQLSILLDDLVGEDRLFAVDILVSGLMIDGAHHKQFQMEQALKNMGVDLVELRNRLQRAGYDWDDGIPG